ncbi:glycosyltransferase WbuB [Kaistia sp. 32K]|nr:glycosyltransferase WbuB [Kaistia sp. 32K]
MRIVLVNRYFHPDESATSRMVSSLAFGLAAQGIEVHVLASRFRHDDPDSALPRLSSIHAVRVHRLAATHFGRSGLAGRASDYLSFHAAVASWCLRHIHRDDIVIACTDPPLLSVTLAAVLAGRGARLVTWLHDIFPEVAIELGVVGKGGPLARLTLALRDGSLCRAHCNVVPTDAMARALRARDIAPDTTAVIPYWSEEEIVPIEAGQNRLRCEWGLGEGFVVGYSGNFGRAHEFGTLLDAAEHLREDPGIRFLLIGGGFARKSIEAEIARRRLGNIELRPLQPRDRLSESLGIADVHLISLLPKLEPYVVPSKLYGILAAGRPAIFIGAGDGEVASALRRHDCGETVPIGAGELLANRIRALRDDPALRSARCERARLAFETTHGRERGVAEWTALLRGVEAGRSSEVVYSAASGDAANE